MASKPAPGVPTYLRVLLALVLVVGILYAAKAVIVPLALAVLLTFVLTPIVGAVQRRGVGRVPAVLITVALTFALIAVVGWGVGVQVSELAQQLPQNKKKIQNKIAELRGSGGAFAGLFQTFREIGEEPAKADTARTEVVVARPEEASGFTQLAQTVGPVLEPLATAGLVVILVIFMLIKREDLRNRLLGLIGHGRLTGSTRVMADAAQRVGKYLLTQLLVNVSFGVVFGVGLLAIHVPYAFLWAFLAAVLRFIPYIGTWIAVAFPLLLSFTLSDGWAQPLEVLVFFALLDLVTANVVEPLLFGHSTGVTPVALLIAAVFWTWVWGPIGLVLSTPLTVCLVVLGQHVPRLKFFSLLLGDEPALEPHASYYQRLLAKDRAEARQVVEVFAGANEPDKVYDEVLLPALVLARRDRALGGLLAEDEQFVFQATREILYPPEPVAAEPAGADGRPAAPDVKPAGEGPPAALLLGYPAHHEAEELSLHMLSRLLKADNCRVEVLSTKVLPGEVESRVGRENPALVFIAVLPPGGLVQARYLCKRLRKRYPDLPIVIGYWGQARDFDRLLGRCIAAGVSYVTTSLLQSRTQIRALLRTAETQAAAPRLQPAGAS